MSGALTAFQNLLLKQQRCDVNLLRIATIAADGEEIVIGADTFPCVTSPDADFEFAPGADAAGSITNIAAIINSDNTQDLTALAITGVGVLVVSDRPGQRGLACTETLAGANNGWAAAAMYGATARNDEFRPFDVAPVTPNAVEVAAGRLAVRFGFAPTAWVITVRTSAGASKAWDGVAAVHADDDRVLILDNSGSTDWTATDEVVILAIG